MDIIDERYTRGKIYKIVCNETGEVYYGSTIRKYISDRIAHHRCEKKCESKHIINRNNYYYELVEVYSCNNVYELETRERWYIENNNCINNRIPTRTMKEWYEDNTGYNKAYYQQNKEQMKEQRKEKITCSICGSIVRKCGLKRHQRTPKCINYN